MVEYTDIINAKTKGFNKIKALDEAIKHTSIAEYQVTSAVNEYIRWMRDEKHVVPSEIEKYREKYANFTAKSLLENMLREFPLTTFWGRTIYPYNK